MKFTSSACAIHATRSFLTSSSALGDAYRIRSFEIGTKAQSFRAVRRNCPNVCSVLGKSAFSPMYEAVAPPVNLGATEFPFGSGYGIAPIRRTTDAGRN